MKRLLRFVLDVFESDDHEYIRASFGRGLFAGWITILEPRYRYRWHRRMMPWRLRLRIASLVRKLVWSRCTRCDKPFSWRELTDGKSNLTFFMSGSICHNDCEPSESFRKMLAEMAAREARFQAARVTGA